jgi:hypothetical protein
VHTQAMPSRGGRRNASTRDGMDRSRKSSSALRQLPAWHCHCIDVLEGSCGWQAVNAPLRGALTTTAAMGNWLIISRIIDQLTANLPDIPIRILLKVSHYPLPLLVVCSYRRCPMLT